MNKDTRYSIQREYTGHISGEPQYVLRFCGVWISSSETLEGANILEAAYVVERAVRLQAT